MNFAMALQTFHPAAIGPFVAILVFLIVIGLCLWLVETYVPMAPPFKVLIRVVIVLIIVLWLLRSFGVF